MNKSWSIQEILYYVPPRKLISWSSLNKRIYYQIAPALITKIHLWKKKAFCILSDDSGIRMLDGGNLEWVELGLSEFEGDGVERYVEFRDHGCLGE